MPDGPYVRNDSGCYEGAEIPVHYDPMISKLVVWGEDRARALSRACAARSTSTWSRGIETNLAFHRRCFRHAAVRRGRLRHRLHRRATRRSSRPRADEAELTAAIIAAALDSGAAGHAAKPAASNGTAVPHAAAPTEISGWRRGLL